MLNYFQKPETRHWYPLKPSIHPYVQFPSNRSHKVLWHVLQCSTQSNPWSPSEHSVKYNTVHIMNIIEKRKKKKEKREKKTRRKRRRQKAVWTVHVEIGSNINLSWFFNQVFWIDLYLSCLAIDSRHTKMCLLSLGDDFGIWREANAGKNRIVQGKSWGQRQSWKWIIVHPERIQRLPLKKENYLNISTKQ